MTLTVPAADAASAATPLDLTPYTLSAILHVGSAKTTVSATTTSPTTGVLLVTVPASSTSSIPGDPICIFPDEYHPTRVQVITTDANGDNVTQEVIPIQVLIP